VASVGPGSALRQNIQAQSVPLPSLWATAPAWRNLAICASCLTALAIAAPFSIPGEPAPATGSQTPVRSSQAEATTPSRPETSQAERRACGLGPDSAERLAVGTIVRFISPEAARGIIMKTQARTGGTISPAYEHQQRVLVQVEPRSGNSNPTVVVPDQLNVAIGDVVQFSTGHRDLALPCGYIPNTIDKIVSPEWSAP